MVVNQQAPSPAQYDMLNELIKESKEFIAAYDTIVLHKELYRNVLLFSLSCLREKLVELIQKFSKLPKEDNKTAVIDCCGVSYNKYDCFKEHYEQVHNRKALQSASLCELKMSLTKISFFERRIRGYLKGGEISSCEMIMNLKKILKKIDMSLVF
ncbi:AAEL010174-PA [Aedes aegypti]|uniref:AAEL010174-PA n=1 Tax=Aedes aegypti TaxID=7159 RepID=Q16TN7_AEDAE|nr:AAEL010174-PA [Aedes aegypti]